ncbi:MAG: transglutaminaseTgpA domain-containing protein [Cyanobacteriota bacterium]|nr:transglutaminaseTgpA domain-containing protein [Cyanobacteriota bacterium]
MAQSRTWRNLPFIGQFWQRLEALPPPVPEDSIALRVLVQSLVIVGVIATDIAANEQMSLWAVPLSIAGATWSWYRRRDRNVVTKFALAFAMLFALANFLGELLGSLNDTRLVLAQLLIQIQVLHTFDLPRRKDLGYSMVIGLILLGVAGTLSQTLAFGPLLLLFLALALPTFVLDYRSRLGLVPTQSKGKRQAKLMVGMKSTLYLIPVVAVLGLLLFALMPRMPGYQLRSLPVSSTIEFQGEFDGRNIINPVEGEFGEGGNGTATGEDGSGSGEIDEESYYGFSNQIDQTRSGQMTPKLVMRVRSQAKGFWRVLGFDRYTGKGWEVSRLDDVEKFNRSSWTFRFMLPRFYPPSGTQEVIQTYTLAADLPSLVPALDRVTQLYFPTRQVALDTEGGLRSPVKLSEGLTYSVISQVPYRDRTALENASTEYADPIREHYLQIPPEIAEKVRQHTQEILDRADPPLADPYSKSLYLGQYLKQNYQMASDPLEVLWLQEDRDLVEGFLFQCEGVDSTTCRPRGYPDHFSTALTMMLRSIGIPARLVAGFAPGEFNPFTGLYEVWNTDAYAMTEVYFPNYGWFPFDPIPGNELIPPSVNDYEAFSVLRQFWRWVAGLLPARLTAWLEDTLGALFAILGGLLGRLFRGWVGLFSGLIALVSFGFLGWLSWQGWRQWRRRCWLGKLPAMERLYQQLLGWSANKGFPKHPSQTPLEYARAARKHYPNKVAEAIESIIRSYVRWRYGGISPNMESQRENFLQLQGVKNEKLKVKN